MMHKRSLILLALASVTLCHVRATVVELPGPNLRQKRMTNDTNSDSQPVINMNGHYNYQAAQQIIFINGTPQRRRKGAKAACLSFVERDDYLVTAGIGVHKLHKRRVVWNHARRSCLDEGGQLAIINSEREEKFLSNWMITENIKHAWLGIHDQFEEGDWITLKGESLGAAGFEKWSPLWPNQPDNYGGNQNCGVLEKDGGLDDTDCNGRQSYFCELNLC